MPDHTTIDGACHCRNVRFELLWPETPVEIPTRICGCTFCKKHGGAWTSHPKSELFLTIDDLSLISKYRFGTGTAEFYVCSVCGVVPIVLSEIDDKIFAVVNVNAFADTRDLTLSRSSTDFDGEDSGSRLERRQRNWIPKVRLGKSQH